MELTPVACNNCGGPLRLPEAARYVTCQHCSTQLEVKRNESIAWTEKQQQLESIDRRTEYLAEEVAQLRYHSELNHVHRAWEREEQRYMVRDKYGNTHRPSAAGSAIVACAFVLIGIGLMFAGDTAVFGLLMMIIGGISGFYGNQRAIAYQRARKKYRRRCSEVRLEDYRLDLEEHPEQLSGNPFSFLPPPPGTGPKLTAGD